MGSFARSLPIDPLHSFLADFCLVCGISGTLGVSEQELDFRFPTSCAEALRLWPKTWQRLGYPRAWSNGMFIHVHSCSLSSIARHIRHQALREFAEYIPADSSGEANRGIGEDQVRSAIRWGIIQIGQCS